MLDALAPAWVARGRRAYLAPKANGDLGSWQVELAGPDRGLWVRYSQPSDRGGRFMGGGPLGLVAFCLSGETSSRVDGRACDWARAFLGMRDERAEARAAREARVAAAKDRERAPPRPPRGAARAGGSRRARSGAPPAPRRERRPTLDGLVTGTVPRVRWLEEDARKGGEA